MPSVQVLVNESGQSAGTTPPLPPLAAAPVPPLPPLAAAPVPPLPPLAVAPAPPLPPLAVAPVPPLPPLAVAPAPPLPPLAVAPVPPLPPLVLASCPAAPPVTLASAPAAPPPVPASMPPLPATPAAPPLAAPVPPLLPPTPAAPPEAPLAPALPWDFIRLELEEHAAMIQSDANEIRANRRCMEPSLSQLQRSKIAVKKRQFEYQGARGRRRKLPGVARAAQGHVLGVVTPSATDAFFQRDERTSRSAALASLTRHRPRALDSPATDASRWVAQAVPNMTS